MEGDLEVKGRMEEGEKSSRRAGKKRNDKRWVDKGAEERTESGKNRVMGSVDSRRKERITTERR